MERWAADDLRSVNAQIEYVLRQALVKQGRVKLVEKVVVEVEEIDSTQKENHVVILRVEMKSMKIRIMS